MLRYLTSMTTPEDMVTDLLALECVQKMLPRHIVETYIIQRERIRFLITMGFDTNGRAFYLGSNGCIHPPANIDQGDIFEALFKGRDLEYHEELAEVFEEYRDSFEIEAGTKIWVEATVETDAHPQTGIFVVTLNDAEQSRLVWPEQIVKVL